MSTAAITQRQLFLRTAVPSWMAAMAISTPIIALLQGALLLQDYRSNHGHAPRPDMPARGVVVVDPANEQHEHSTSQQRQRLQQYIATSTTTTAQQQQQQQNYTTRQGTQSSKPPRDQPPIRLLVIGDSLAAGVGVSESGTPALPEAIARGLSQATGGRAVYWTCVGTPGTTSTEIVQEIHQLDDIVDNDNNGDSGSLLLSLPERLRIWQVESRFRANERLRLARLRAQRWLKHRKEPVIEKEDIENGTGQTAYRVVIWWKRKRAEIQRDLRELGQLASLKDVGDGNGPLHAREMIPRMPVALKRRKTFDPKVVGEYDIAIVLTGLNDLKDSFLPFMMSAKRLKEMNAARSETGSMSIKDELVRVVHALKKRMDLLLPGEERTSPPSVAKTEQESDALEAPSTGKKERQGSLVVFPALPFFPSSFSQLAPLCWFIDPLVRSMDANKKMLADMYPETVVFVESPSVAFFAQTEARKGPIWEDVDFRKEKVLLKLTDIAQDVRQQVEETMRQHYKNWVLDAQDDGYYDIVADSVSHSHDGSQKSHPGATMVACDGVHPNDAGYELWGRFIASQVAKEWKQKQGEIAADR